MRNVSAVHHDGIPYKHYSKRLLEQMPDARHLSRSLINFHKKF